MKNTTILLALVATLSCGLAFKASAEPEKTKARIKVVGGSVYLRTLPSASGAICAVVHEDEVLPTAGEAVNGWFPVVRDGKTCYISGKYAEVSAI